jgi:hypothetical protein
MTAASQPGGYGGELSWLVRVDTRQLGENDMPVELLQKSQAYGAVKDDGSAVCSAAIGSIRDPLPDWFGHGDPDLFGGRLGIDETVEDLGQDERVRVVSDDGSHDSCQVVCGQVCLQEKHINQLGCDVRGGELVELSDDAGRPAYVGQCRLAAFVERIAQDREGAHQTSS